jgi:hypothetical protein
MPLPIILNGFRIAIKLQKASVPDHFINVIHCKSTSDITASAMNGFIQPRWQAAFDFFIPNIYTWAGTTITKLDGSSAIDFPWTHTQPQSTAISSGCQVACCVGWRTPNAGRSHRGRSYIGPIPATAPDPTKPDFLDTSFKANVEAAAGSMITGLSTDNVPLQVASYLHASMDEVTHAKVNPLVCTQRKRVNSR